MRNGADRAAPENAKQAFSGAFAATGCTYFELNRYIRAGAVLPAIWAWVLDFLPKAFNPLIYMGRLVFCAWKLYCVRFDRRLQITGCLCITTPPPRADMDWGRGCYIAMKYLLL